MLSTKPTSTQSFGVARLVLLGLIEFFLAPGLPRASAEIFLDHDQLFNYSLEAAVVSTFGNRDHFANEHRQVIGTASTPLPFDAHDVFFETTGPGTATLSSTVHLDLDSSHRKLTIDWTASGTGNSSESYCSENLFLNLLFTLTSDVRYVWTRTSTTANQQVSPPGSAAIVIGSISPLNNNNSGALDVPFDQGTASGTLHEGIGPVSFALAAGFDLRLPGSSSTSFDFQSHLRLTDANDFYWTNAGGGSFATPTNWDANEFPTEENGAVFDLNSNYTVAVTNASVDHLSVQDGTLTISGEITTNKGIVDGILASPATLKLSGSNSKLQLADASTDPRTLMIGDIGSGALAIANGALLDTTRARLGQNPGSQGKVTIDGTGSVFEALDLHVGVSGNGTVEVTNGGELRIVNDGSLIIADEASSVSKVTIEGAQSKLTASGAGRIGVGDSGHGVLEIRGGATADIPGLGIGGKIGDFNHPGDGTVVIDGVGTKVTSLNWTIGVVPVGLGRMTLSGGAVAEVGVDNGLPAGGIVTVGSVNSFGILNVTGSGTKLSTDDLFIGLPSGTLQNAGTGLVRIDHGRVDAFFFSVGPSSRIEMIDGLLSSSGGNVSVGGAILGTGHVIVANQSVLTVNGFIAPGLSPGVLTIDGNYQQTATAELHIEFAGLVAGTQYDQLIVNGDATLDGTLFLTFIQGFAPHQGDHFDFLNVTGDRSGGFTGIVIENLAPGFQYNVSSNGRVFTLTALNDGMFVPEPTTFVLLFLGSMLTATRRSEKKY